VEASRPRGGRSRTKHGRVGGIRRAALGQPAGHRLADVGGQRQAVAAAALAADGDLTLAPVDVAQLQAGDLPGAQAQPGQQHDDRVIPAAGHRRRSQLSMIRARSAGLTPRGSAASCQHAADGTAPASGTVICPSR
jgi:hypothetical protein